MPLKTILSLLTTTLALGLSPATSLADGHDQALAEALSAQPEAVQARYGARHPGETLMFFGIKPGMTVVEALPGGGWYSKILLDYLGPEGHLVGADYAQPMFPLFGFFSDEAIEKKKTWVETWTTEASEWVPGGASVSAFQLGSMPKDMNGSADAVLLIRALHNLARFEGQGAYLTSALADVHAVLKPGGMVGVVQHEGRADMDDAQASGGYGYLKKDFVKASMAAAGFEFVAESAVNENPKDQPAAGDRVWRLPPTLSGTRDDPEKRAAVEAIGESNRMTLLFRKPAN